LIGLAGVYVVVMECAPLARAAAAAPLVVKLAIELVAEAEARTALARVVDPSMNVKVPAGGTLVPVLATVALKVIAKGKTEGLVELNTEVVVGALVMVAVAVVVGLNV
jgi:hypothetical protein